MTARKPPNPDGLNAVGTGKGLKKVTRPVTKKRGASTTEEGTAVRVVQARGGIDTSTYEGAELVDPSKPLTEKQKLFVKFWAQGESIASASARAGYGDGATFAYRMVRMPNVLKMYEAEKAKYEEVSQMTRKRVMDGLLEAAEMAKMMAEPASMVSAWREIGKMCGYFEPVQKKIDITVSGNVVMQRMDRMTDAELLRLIQETVTDSIDEDDDEDKQ